MHGLARPAERGGDPGPRRTGGDRLEHRVGLDLGETVAQQGHRSESFVDRGRVDGMPRGGKEVAGLSGVGDRPLVAAWWPEVQVWIIVVHAAR